MPGAVNWPARSVAEVGDLVGVFCGSNAGRGDRYVRAAEELGTAIAARGLGLVYGGGHVGLMGAVADSALAGGADVVGVMTEHLVGAEIAHERLTRLEVVATMHARKARMAELAAGFVVLPGGFGTLDETLELLTWNQLGLIAKPVVLLDVDGFFGPLLDFVERAVAERFIHPAHAGLAQLAATADDAVTLATTSPPDAPSKWFR